MTLARIEWRRVPISPYRNYEVSSDGRVRRDGRELRGDTDQHGYRRVLLSYAGVPKRFSVHRLVCIAFHGEPPSNLEVAHLDGNPANNCADNLVWVSHAENIGHKAIHGTVLEGEEHPRAILTDDQAREIFLSPETANVIAQRLGVSRHTIGDIRERKRWKTATEGLQRPVRFGTANYRAALPDGFIQAASSKPHWSALAAQFGISKATVYRYLAIIGDAQ